MTAVQSPPNKSAPTSSKSPPNPLPYIIIFAVLFLITMAVATWTLDLWYKANQCAIYPNIWCSNNWTCNNSCTGGQTGQYNSCFYDYGTGTTGLALCLMGPNSVQGQLCFNPTGPTGSTSCDCVAPMQSANNCLAGCPQNLNAITGNPTCCCNDPNNPNCTISACQGTT